MYDFDETLDAGLRNFYNDHYRRHNEARLTHLASLGLDLHGKRVLEVGAGPGHHTWFYVVRECDVTATDARSECVAEIAKHFPSVRTAVVDMNDPQLRQFGKFDIVHCYGLLYHLQDPQAAIASMAEVCDGQLLLETCVTPGDEEAINLVCESASDFTQSSTNKGCRPTRPWVMKQLRQHFPWVYVPLTQPNHEEFPTDWSATGSFAALTRMIAIASRTELAIPGLAVDLPTRQTALGRAV